MELRGRREENGNKTKYGKKKRERKKSDTAYDSSRGKGKIKKIDEKQNEGEKR